MEDKIVALIIPQIMQQPQSEENMHNLANHWDNSLTMSDQPLTMTSMIFLMWNCRGINNQGFNAHFRELLNYHKPSFRVLT